MSLDARLDDLRAWLGRCDAGFALRIDTLRPASDDASFRRYFRVDRADGGTLVAMDAPPPAEDCRPFVHAAEAFAGSGLRVPHIHAADTDRGFLLLEDFGATTYLDRFDAGGERDADRLYRQAITSLVTLQADDRRGRFPPYDRALLERELALYPEWYVARHRGITLTDDERAALSAAFAQLVDAVLAQPVVAVHRDFHSRNLMDIGDDGPGVLDFQDAVEGPITYDLVSLLRDAYVDWPEARELDWVVRYWEAARAASLPVPADFGDFYRDYEWMGVQRQLKVLGIFARLSHRDGKHRYVDDMPRVLCYLRRTLGRYRALAGLARLVDRIESVAPRVGYTF